MHVDADCFERFDTKIGCMRTEDGGKGSCPLVGDDDNCIYRETDGGVELFTGGQAVLPRGFRQCSGVLTQQYRQASQGGVCP